MIPADCWHDNGDGTAWVVQRKSMWMLDRPCDTCHGRKRVEAEFWDLTDPDNLLGWVPCPDCDGTGRHTFTVEVGEHARPPSLALERSGEASCDGCARTLPVSVVPGMVLPIISAVDDYPEASHMSIGESECWLWEWDSSDSDFICHENVAIPPASRPGMWAVRVNIHE